MAFMWAAAICTALPAPPTPSNLRGLNAWINCENGPRVTGNNPMNTSLRCCGFSGMKNSIVPTYPNPAAGVLATVRTLRGGYSTATSSMRRGTLGRDMARDPNAILTRDDGAHWGTRPSCLGSGSGGGPGAPPPPSGAGGPSLRDKAAATLGLGAVGAGGLLVVAVLVLGAGAWWLLKRKA